MGERDRRRNLTFALLDFEAIGVEGDGLVVKEDARREEGRDEAEVGGEGRERTASTGGRVSI